MQREFQYIEAISQVEQQQFSNNNQLAEHNEYKAIYPVNNNTEEKEDKTTNKSKMTHDSTKSVDKSVDHEKLHPKSPSVERPKTSNTNKSDLAVMIKNQNHLKNRDQQQSASYLSSDNEEKKNSKIQRKESNDKIPKTPVIQ